MLQNICVHLFCCLISIFAVFTGYLPNYLCLLALTLSRPSYLPEVDAPPPPHPPTHPNLWMGKAGPGSPCCVPVAFSHRYQGHRGVDIYPDFIALKWPPRGPDRSLSNMAGLSIPRKFSIISPLSLSDRRVTECRNAILPSHFPLHRRQPV